MRDCLQVEPDERPSAKDLVNRLAGSSTMARTISNRSSSLSVSGHISGQHLADRCAHHHDPAVSFSAQPCCASARGFSVCDTLLDMLDPCVLVVLV